MRLDLPSAARPAVFLDRDGTLNEEKGYVHRIQDWVWLPGVPAAISKLNRLGLLTIVVTNQAGVGRGYYDIAQVDRLHRYAQEDLLSSHGGHIDAFFYCPHVPSTEGAPLCPCRKPRPGLIHRAARELNVDLARSFLIGDKASDVLAGQAAGVESLLVLTGYGPTERKRSPADVAVVADLGEATAVIVNRIERDQPRTRSA